MTIETLPKDDAGVSIEQVERDIRNERQEAYDSKVGIYFAKELIEAVMNGLVDISEAQKVIEDAKRFVESTRKKGMGYEAVFVSVTSILEGIQLTEQGHREEAAKGSGLTNTFYPGSTFSADFSFAPHSIDSISIGLERAGTLLKLCGGLDTDKESAYVVQKVLAAL